MNIRLYLKDYPYINDEVLCLQKELNKLIRNKHEAYCTLQAMAHTGVPSEKTNNIYDVSNTVQILVDRFDRKIINLTNKINSLLDEKALFDKAWFNSNISNEDRTIIQLKAFEHRSWREVAKAMKYSDKQCQRLFDKAVSKIQYEVDKLLSASEERRLQ